MMMIMIVMMMLLLRELCKLANVSIIGILKLTSFSDDLKQSRHIPGDRYKLVKYEDLISEPEGTMMDLYSFAGIPVSKKMLVKINHHFNAELLNKTG